MRIMNNGIERGSRGFATERGDTGRSLVKHHAEGKQVRPAIQFLAEGLFGRHVSGCPHGRPGNCQILLGGFRKYWRFFLSF